MADYKAIKGHTIQTVAGDPGNLAAGLIWSLCITDLIWSKNIALFFLSCVAIAGIYGAYSVTKKIFFVQGIPAILGILSLIFVN